MNTKFYRKKWKPLKIYFSEQGEIYYFLQANEVWHCFEGHWLKSSLKVSDFDRFQDVELLAEVRNGKN